ncbi:MAG: Fe-S cluster assembly protein SufD [Pseudomonadota bacterium]|nr:Fe-S cluster assembly protein SufD [Pseudomonadota bacterium]
MMKSFSSIREHKALAKKFSPAIKSAMAHYAQLTDDLNKACDKTGVVQLRQQAQQQFMQTGFPTRRDEDWGYTNLTGFLQTHYRLEGLSQVSMADIAPFLPSYPATRIVLIDGWFSENLSDDLSGLPKGITIESTNDASEVPVYIDGLTASEETVAKEPFGLLNSMLLNDGFNLQVKANTTVEMPIFVLHVQTQNQHVSNLRNRIVVEENAELTLVEAYVSLSEQTEFNASTNVVTQIDVAKYARVKQVILQEQNVQGYYFNNQFIKQGANSLFNSFYAGVGSLVSRHQNHLEMNGDHIETIQNSACYARDRQTVDSRTYTGHNDLNGLSQQLHKYVLDGQAVGVFDGMIKVARAAQKTDGQMDNKNLLLSKTAKMDSKPQLEIYADDVKCSHGSATGQISADQIFYLQARGIKKPQAIQMITEAFLLEPVESINQVEIRNWIADILSQKLNKHNG